MVLVTRNKSEPTYWVPGEAIGLAGAGGLAGDTVGRRSRALRGSAASRASQALSSGSSLAGEAQCHTNHALLPTPSTLQSENFANTPKAETSHFSLRKRATQGTLQHLKYAGCQWQTLADSLLWGGTGVAVRSVIFSCHTPWKSSNE